MSRGFTRDAMLEIALGNMTGVSHVNKFGHNSDIDTGTVPETIWDGGGLYVPPTASRTHDIVSTSTQDAGTVTSTGTFTTTSTTLVIDSGATFVTDGVAVNDAVLDDTGRDHSYVLSIDSETQLTVEELHHNGAFTSGNTYRVVTPAGTGCSVLHIKKGLNGDKTPTSEWIVMNGTTNVPTVNTYHRISRMHSDGCGSNGVNVGDISATAQTDATVTAIVGVGEGQTLMAVFTIPKGQTGYVVSVWSSMTRDASGTASADMELIGRPYGMDDPFGTRVLANFGIASKGSSFAEVVYQPYMVIEAQTDLFINCVNTSSSNVKVSAGFNLILVDD